MNSLPKIVTRQRRDCDLNPNPSAPESSTLTTRLPSLIAVSTVATEENCLASKMRCVDIARSFPVIGADST